MPTLPALRLTSEGKGCAIEDITERLQNSNIDSIKEVVDQGLSFPTNHVASQDVATVTDTEGGPLPPNNPMNSISERTSPIVSRTLSMPLPSQLTQLQNPHRPGLLNSRSSVSQISSAPSSRVDEVSIELADSIQMVIQTMLQISPPQVLDPAKEQFSACAISVPTSSMSAMFAAIKNINYISANMPSFCDFSPPPAESTMSQETGTEEHNEFDIGEMLQCIGDALSGAAAQAGVDLVIYHGEVGLKHFHVSGDESGISFSLSHIVRQVLNTTERGDSIELGLLSSPICQANLSQAQNTKGEQISAPPDGQYTMHITIQISHRFAPSEASQNEDVLETRPDPDFSTLFFRRILRRIGGTIRSDLPPPKFFSNGRTCQFDFDLIHVPKAPATPLCTSGQNQPVEPTLTQLSSFKECLKGKRVSLYASVQGSFGRHLTSYLTSWGMDVTHISPCGEVDNETANQSASSAIQAPITVITDAALTLTRVEPQPGAPELIFIDDDVDVLKDRLHTLRNGGPSGGPSKTYPRKKPSLQANHRPRSSQQIYRVSDILRGSTTAIILYFTSLSNFKLVKDVVQSVMASYASMAISPPEIMIIPKPAGPRRFLTALHTAITKPVMDPFFIPIATSPVSPGTPTQVISTLATNTPVGESFSNVHNGQSNTAAATPQSPVIKASSRPTGSRTNSERSIISLEGSGGLQNPGLPPSPLALPDHVEYFSATAQKLGNSPSSGVVIQSPDGQTTGIYFHPRSKNTSRHASSNNIEKEPMAPRRQSTSRVASSPNNKDTMSFSYLYQTPRKSRSPSTPHATTSDIVAFDDQPSSSNTPTTAKPSPTEIITTQLDIQQPKPSTPSPTSIRSPSRRASVDSRGTRMSPPIGLGDGSGSKRSSSRKPAGTDTKDTPETPSTLPAKQKGRVSAMGDAHVVPPISVLIVDDNPINQTILSTFMRRKKIKYDLASNGQEAVQKWRSGGFHLILMDIQMPILDGIQATKEIRRLEKLNSEAGYPPLSPLSEGPTPSEASAASSSSSDTKNTNSPYRSSVIIVALTASSLQSDRVAALAAGCNDFLTKPVSLLWLNNKIIEWGSIKALQMWADIRPEAVRSITSGQSQQAKSIADRLHVPPRGRMTPIPAVRSPSLDENAAALALASSGGTMLGLQSYNGLNRTPSPTIPTSSFVDPVSSPSDSDSLEVKSSLVSSTEKDDRSKIINVENSLSRRPTPTSRTQERSHNAGFGSDTVSSYVLETEKPRENGPSINVVESSPTP